MLKCIFIVPKLNWISATAVIFKQLAILFMISLIPGVTRAFNTTDNNATYSFSFQLSLKNRATQTLLQLLEELNCTVPSLDCVCQEV